MSTYRIKVKNKNLSVRVISVGEPSGDLPNNDMTKPIVEFTDNFGRRVYHYVSSITGLQIGYNFPDWDADSMTKIVTWLKIQVNPNTYDTFLV